MVRIEDKTKFTESRTFNLSVPVSRLFLVGWSIFSVIQIANGLFSLKRGDEIFGIVQLAFGVSFLLFVGLTPRENKYVITFEDANLKIERSLSRQRTIPWTSITEIHILLMKIEFLLENGKNVTWNFNMSYTDNQIVKPKIIAALTEYAEAREIPVKDCRAT